MLKSFTGERFEPNLQGEIRLEHFHRYALALELVKDKVVLDLACGEGYGSFMLSKYASAVLGVDLSNEVITHAQKRYSNKAENLHFQQGSASKLSLQNAAFDVVVSFETIEHLYEQSEMLEEIRRVLRPDGILIISSPNKSVYSKNGQYQNHFHVKELDFSEFDSLLKKQFKAVEYFGQRLQIGSVIKSIDQNKDYFKAWTDDGKVIKPETARLPQPVYYIAVCAANTKYLPEVSPSVFYPNKLDLLAQYQNYAAWAKSTDVAIDEARRVIQAKEEEHQKIVSWAKDLDSQLASSRAQAQSLAAAREEAFTNAQNLAGELNASQTRYQNLVLEHEKTARWGQGLSTELDEARRVIQAKEEEHQKIVSWAKDLDSQLASSREEFIDVLEAYEADLSGLEKLTWEFNRSKEINVQQSCYIEKLSAEALSRNLQISQYSNQLSKVITELGASNRTLEAFNQKIYSLEIVIGQNNTDIAILEDCISQRDEQIAELDHETVKRGEWALGLQAQLDSRHVDIEHLNSLISQRDQKIAELDLETVRRGEWALGLQAQLDNRYVEIDQLNSLISQRDQKIAELDLETVRRGEWALGLINDLHSKQEELSQILASNSWLLTKPFREARRWIFSPIQQSKRYLSIFLSLMKREYQKLPFSYVTRNRHKALIGNFSPWILRLSNTSNNFIYSRSTSDALTFHSRDLEIDFALPTSPNPIVSVIIPIYGKVEFTLACLRSIAKWPPKTPFEVIVVDDCSPDNSAEILAQIDGLEIYSNKENQGFIKSCNAGARISKGPYIYFLNNDTEVTEGWLDNLYQTFSDFPGTGFVGSKLIYPDGSLQEAGGIIWRDGSAWNFGRNQDAAHPLFNYAREVDYCSGASIMIPRNIFDDMGGFDELYTPAYCEDSDLALKIRRAGYRVIYQPSSVVVHFEGVSSGNDTSQGVKAFQIENSKKLLARWKHHLESHQSNGVDVDDAKDRAFNKRVLVIDHCTPTPNQDAGSITTVNTIILLREFGFQVTFIPEDNFLYMPEETVALQRIGVEVLYAPYVQSVEEHIQEFGGRYDLVFLFRPVVVEKHIKKIRKFCLNAKVLFHTIDLHFLRMSREALLQSDKTIKDAADFMKEREILAINSVDATIVHSTSELEILSPLVPKAKLHVFPLILDVKGTQKQFKDRRNILFVGGFQHAPNVDAVDFFAKEIMPILRLRCNGIRFLVAGSRPPSNVLALETDDIHILGFVEDLSSLLDSVRVSVAPLRYGAGIKGKIGTAMAAGLPIVATTIAAEGMSLSAGDEILIADSPEEFAESILRLCEDEDLWTRISQHSIEFANKQWSGVAASRILEKILTELDIEVTKISNQLKMYTS